MRACQARCQEGSWPKDEILHFLGSSWVLGEIVVRSYLFILVYANFDNAWRSTKTVQSLLHK